MITDLRIQNFRCFDDHELPLRPMSVVVGANNAGKTTLIEALRVISVFVNRYRTLNYREAPAWTGLPRYGSNGPHTSLGPPEYDFATAFHRYGDPPAILTARFESGASVAVYLGRSRNDLMELDAHAVIRDADGHVIRDRPHARTLSIPAVTIMPAAGPFARHENLLTADYIRECRDSHLAPIHFRNQLRLFDRYFDEFKALAERTWPGFAVDRLEVYSDQQKRELLLFVRDQDFVGEVGAMGHGLQMWLQTMWFLARTEGATTAILDEPDIFMHADLQRKLIPTLRGRYPQVIVATHSIEILSAARADDVLIVDRSQHRSQFATSIPAVQEMISRLGSVHNIYLSRLWNARQFLLVEGDDLDILKRVHRVLFPASHKPLDAIPNKSIGGWGGWEYCVRICPPDMKNGAGYDVARYCILDSDYFPAALIQERLKHASRQRIELHVWARKELENYLLNPQAVKRVIAKRLTRTIAAPDERDVADEMLRIAMSLRDTALDATAHELNVANRAGGVAAANRSARQRIETAFATPAGALGIVSGKTVLAELSAWSQVGYGVSFGAGTIADELRPDEVPDEMVGVLRAIEREEGFA